MVKIILLLSILLLSCQASEEFMQAVAEKFSEFNLKDSMEYLVNDKDFQEKASQTCFSTLQNYVQNFQNHTKELGMMAFNSGRDLNDIGRFTDCMELNYTRFITLSVDGLPLGLYLGI